MGNGKFWAYAYFISKTWYNKRRGYADHTSKHVIRYGETEAAYLYVKPFLNEQMTVT